MKRYIRLSVIAALAAAAASCTNLETEIVGSYTQFPDNPIAISGEFEGCYYYQRNEAWFGRNFWEGVGASADEYIGVNFNGDYDDNGRYYRAAIHDPSPDNPGTGLWATCCPAYHIPIPESSITAVLKAKILLWLPSVPSAHTTTSGIWRSTATCP